VYAILFAPPLLGLVWSVLAWFKVTGIKLEAPTEMPANLATPLTDEMSMDKRGESVKEMIRLSGIIERGAITFLKAEYRVMAVFIVVFSGVLMLVTGVLQNDMRAGIATTVSFVAGSLTSVLCGWIGMMIAVKTNVKTTHACWTSMSGGFDVALVGGSVMGLSLVSIGVLGLLALVLCMKQFSGMYEKEEGGFDFEQRVKMFECIAGYGLGGSAIALFGRVGGGIYTKAADVGADLAGKLNAGLEEDDVRNPATIADNVGDNVGDIAGMGADLFGSFAEATCAAMVLGCNCKALAPSWASLMYPVLISTAGIVVGMLTLALRSVMYGVDDKKKLEDAGVERALKGVLIISTVLMTPVVVGLSKVCLPPTFTIVDGSAPEKDVQWWFCAVAVVLGLWSGLIIGFVTEYYTSSSYDPVRSIARTQVQSAATGVIVGLAVGYISCVVPTICLGITVLIAHNMVGMYGVALAALGMLGTLTMGLTIDAYGPISDNAGGIAEMTLQGAEGLMVRARTDCLDAAGNTTAAIGKGFAIGSAALVSLALFGAFCVRANVQRVDILNEWVFTGLLLGAMIPYAFAAWTMKSVGLAADEMVAECGRQFDLGILDEGSKIEPDYEACIKISTDASLREMLAPGALVILSPMIAGLGFGKNACAGMLSGALVSSVQLAISMSNSGGAWDNSKKWISSGGLAEYAAETDSKGNTNFPIKSGSTVKDQYGKGSDAHTSSVTGDTIGDPLKDTSGPALNIVMKLTAIISLVFGSAILKYSNSEGGPIWLPVVAAATAATPASS